MSGRQHDRKRRRTPAKRHISFPVSTSLRTASSPMQVTSLRPSCDTATGPPVYSGLIALAFLKLRNTAVNSISMFANIYIRCFQARSDDSRRHVTRANGRPGRNFVQGRLPGSSRMFRLSARASTSLFRRTVLVHIRTYYRSAMGTTGIDTAPPTHRGMTQLDRNAFHKEVSILAARVPAAKAGLILRASQTKRFVVTSMFL
jgi:hypothetical protein